MFKGDQKYLFLLKLNTKESSKIEYYLCMTWIMWIENTEDFIDLLLIEFMLILNQFNMQMFLLLQENLVKLKLE
jgi:hypothetical protein